MVLRALVFVAVSVVPALTFDFQVEVKSSLHFDSKDSKNRPVAKVVTLLEDMQQQLQQEQEEDEEIYEKMACWCETNDKEKTKAIADAEARISDLNTEIESLSAASARLNTEIEGLKKEVEHNEAALDQATAIRTKQLAEFNAEEKDMLQSISALKSAIVVLSKHHGGSFLEATEMQVVITLQHELKKHAELLKGVLTHRQRKAIQAFAQNPDAFGDDLMNKPYLTKDNNLLTKDYFGKDDSAASSKPQIALSTKSAKGKAAPYQAQSGEIFGILKQMKESFESNLSQSQKDEIANAEAYEQLKAAKEEEIAAGKEQIELKTQELATTDSKLAQAKEDLEDVQNSLSADEKFLMNLKEKCALTDKEWEERQKERNAEIAAVGKALEVLTSDDARDLFTKTFNPALIQETQRRKSRSIERAAKVLSDAAKKLHSPQLTAVALKVRLDAFTKVKQIIDDMVAQLLKDKEDEIKHRDGCIEGLNLNERETLQSERDKKDLTTKIDDLTMEIDGLVKLIETLKGEIAEMKVEMKRAGEDREKQNKEFQAVVADQTATKKLLEQALEVLKGYYEAEKFIQMRKQKQEPAGPPPPPGFKEYGKQSGAAGGVMALIQNIINDAKAMEAAAIKDEEDSQKAYEDFVQDSNKSIEEKETEITNKSELKAEKEGVKTEKEQDLEETMKTLEQLSSTNADLHKDCDYTLKNFDIKQTARDQEIEALKQAKAILSGAKFDALLQA